jgi:hypothetical protein
VLIDTSTLLRTLQPSHPQRDIASVAIKALTARGRDLYIVPQNPVELWVVATRPVANNGLGLSTTEAAAELMRLKSMFPLLPDTPASRFSIPPTGPFERAAHFQRFDLSSQVLLAAGLEVTVYDFQSANSLAVS